MISCSQRLSGLAAVVVAAAATLGLAGCSATNCSGDARYDSLGCASAGLSSGSYRKQVDLMQAEAQLRSSRASSEMSRAESAQQRANATVGARMRAERDVQAQTAEIEALRQQRTALQEQLQKVRSRGGDAPEVAQLQREIQALTTRISRLLEAR